MYLIWNNIFCNQLSRKLDRKWDVSSYKHFTYAVKYRLFLKIYSVKSITAPGSISIKAGVQEYMQTDKLDLIKSLN